jgi:hypothetical protein
MDYKYKPILINLIKQELLVLFFFSLPIALFILVKGWAKECLFYIIAVIIGLILSGAFRVFTYSDIEIRDSNIKVVKGIFANKRTILDYSSISAATLDRYPKLDMFNRLAIIYIKKDVKTVFSIYQSYYTNEQFEEIQRLVQEKSNHLKK